MFKRYSNPEATGWLGWFEDSAGNTIAFVGLDKHIVFMSDLDSTSDDSPASTAVSRLGRFLNRPFFTTPREPNMSGIGKSFGDALELLKRGHFVTRKGWNGKGMYLAIQVPDAHSLMTLPYIYMKTAQEGLVPWVASQTDILTDDWLLA